MKDEELLHLVPILKQLSKSKSVPRVLRAIIDKLKVEKGIDLTSNLQRKVTVGSIMESEQHDPNMQQESDFYFFENSPKKGRWTSVEEEKQRQIIGNYQDEDTFKKRSSCISQFSNFKEPEDSRRYKTPTFDMPLADQIEKLIDDLDESILENEDLDDSWAKMPSNFKHPKQKLPGHRKQKSEMISSSVQLHRGEHQRSWQNSLHI